MIYAFAASSTYCTAEHVKGMSVDRAFDHAAKDIVGANAWGLTRTIGSMFFLHVGEEIATPQPTLSGGAIPGKMGEWRFLFQMCHWRFENADGLILGSDDTTAYIDRCFAQMRLERITAVAASPPFHDLCLEFESGIRLKTFSTMGGLGSDEDAEEQWQLGCPDDFYWAVNTAGRIVRAHRER